MVKSRMSRLERLELQAQDKASAAISGLSLSVQIAETAAWLKGEGPKPTDLKRPKFISPEDWSFRLRKCDVLGSLIRDEETSDSSGIDLGKAKLEIEAIGKSTEREWMEKERSEEESMEPKEPAQSPLNGIVKEWNRV